MKALITRSVGAGFVVAVALSAAWVLTDLADSNAWVEKAMLFATYGTALGTTLLAIGTILMGFAAQDSARAAEDSARASEELAQQGRAQADVARETVLEAARTRIDARSPLLTVKATPHRFQFVSHTNRREELSNGRPWSHENVRGRSLRFSVNLVFANRSDAYARLDMTGAGRVRPPDQEATPDLREIAPGDKPAFTLEMELPIERINEPVDFDFTVTYSSQVDGDISDTVSYRGTVQVVRDGNIQQMSVAVQSSGAKVTRRYPALELRTS